MTHILDPGHDQRRVVGVRPLLIFVDTPLTEDTDAVIER
jgi:hypothetical protein